MSLWDIIRNFFVQYIFGGTDSNGDLFGFFLGRLGSLTGVGNFNFFEEYSNSFMLKLENLGAISGSSSEINNIEYMAFGDYLSTTATIITLIILFIVVCLGIRWLFRFMISRFTKWGL